MRKLIFPLISLVPGVSSGIIVANYSSFVNDRFENDPSFVGAGLDFSGVGRTTNGRWGAMIGDNYFVTAIHFPATGNVQFLTNNNPAGAIFQYTVAGSFNVSGTDIQTGYFNEAVEPSIARYTYNTNNANALADLGIAGTTLYLNGDRIAGSAGTILDHVVAVNQAESWFEEGTDVIQVPGSGGINNTFSNDADFDQIVMFENSESQLQSGDSGSPLFSNQGASLRMEGIAWAVVLPPGFTGNFDTTASGLEQRSGTLYGYLGSYDTDIQNVISNASAPIPEPSGLALGKFGLLAGMGVLLAGMGVLFLRLLISTT